MIHLGDMFFQLPSNVGLIEGALRNGVCKILDCTDDARRQDRVLPLACPICVPYAAPEYGPDVILALVGEISPE